MLPVTRGDDDSLSGPERAWATKAIRTNSASLKVYRVAAIDSQVIQEALELTLPDFEDSVTAAAARRAGCDYIVTRDARGFRGSPVRCLTPEAAAPLFL
jgi:hypothetical protein